MSLPRSIHHRLIYRNPLLRGVSRNDGVCKSAKGELRLIFLKEGIQWIQCH